MATQNSALYRGLVVSDKAERVANFHRATIGSLLELLGAMGVSGPEEVTPDLIHRRVGDMQIRTFAEQYTFLEPRALVDGRDVPEPWSRAWEMAHTAQF